MQPHPSPSDADPVEDLMALCLERPPEEWAEALEEAASDHPEHSRELRERMRLLAAFDSGTAAARDDAAPRLPERLGDFVPLERLGSGGMGVVFRARQESLGRDVALKLIRPERTYFEGSLARFQREVETVARLTHPNIVAIHYVGRPSDGVGAGELPFFAMELLEGATLADVVRAFRSRAPESLSGRDLFEAVGGSGAAPPAFAGTWPEACVRVALQVARALEHAHAHGVLHRDVKPSNVMLAPSGRAVLFDFGLTASRASSGARMTQTGHPVGTLVYMSPEQLEEQLQLDARTDVYSLGVTLYELLALQVPFDGDSAVGIQRAILLGEADPVRARSRRVPADVQVVVAKAMARHRGDRYAGAGELADDLASLLERRPVRATAPSLGKRALRWVQRRPAAASAIALAAVLLAGVPSFFLVLSGRHRAELAALVRDESAAKRAALEANAELEDVLKFALGLFARADPESHGGVVPDAREMLALGAAELPALTARPASRARIELALGNLFSILTDVRAAQPHLDAAIAHYETREDVDSRRRLAEALRLSGHNLSFLGRSDEAGRQLERALDVARGLHGEGGRELEAYHATLADHYATLARFDEALVHRRAALALLEREPGAGDDARVARARGLLGTTLENAGDLAAAEPLLVAALAWGDAHPGELGSEYDLFALTLGDLYSQRGESELALELARATHARLAKQHGPESLMTLQAEFAVAEHLARGGSTVDALEILERIVPLAAARVSRTHPLILRMRLFELGGLGALGRQADVVARAEEADVPAVFVEGLGPAHDQTRRALRAVAVALQVQGALEASLERLTQLEQAERAAGAWSGDHADAILMLVGLRMRMQAAGDAHGPAASEALLHEMIDGIGDAPLAVVSTTNGQTYEAGYMARVFLQGVLALDPTRAEEALAAGADAEDRKRRVQGLSVDH